MSGVATDAPSWTERRSGATSHADDARTAFEIDQARVIHSGSFRRLQGKTQILALGDDDFYRTRLTHSLEVAQVAQGVVQQLLAQNRDGRLQRLLPPAALIATAGLAHDLGHPPFGHGGELALNYCMRADGGFEGNAQTLRLLSWLEGFSQAHGADLTRRSLLAVLKYPARRSEVTSSTVAPSLSSRPTSISVLDRDACKPAKCYYDAEADVVDWVLRPFSDRDRDVFTGVERREPGHGRTRHKSLDCSIMDVADDIAYGVHDLEDAIALGLISEERFRHDLDAKQCQALVRALVQRPLVGDGGDPYDGFVRALFGASGTRKRATGRLVHHLLRGVSCRRLDAFDDDLLALRVSLSADTRELLDALQGVIVREVIDSPRVQHLEFKGQRMVVAVFEAMASDPSHLLPHEVLAAYEAADGDGRIVCDYLASMTDGALLKTYDRLFSPRMGSVFDRV